MIDVKQLFSEAINSASSTHQINEAQEVNIKVSGSVVNFFRKFDASLGKTVTFEHQGAKYKPVSIIGYIVKPTFVESLVEYGQATITTVQATKEGDSSGKKYELTFYANEKFDVFLKVK